MAVGGKKSNAELYEEACRQLGVDDTDEREIFDVFPPAEAPPVSEGEKKTYAALVAAIRRAMERYGIERGLQLADAAVVDAQIRMRDPAVFKPESPHDQELVNLIQDEWQRYCDTHKRPKQTEFARPLIKRLKKRYPKLTVEAVKGHLNRHK